MTSTPQANDTPSAEPNKEDFSKEDVAGVVDAFRELPSKITEIIDFEWGTNNSPERLNDGLTHCFVLTFAIESGGAAYLPHAAHKAFGDILRAHVTNLVAFLSQLATGSFQCFSFGGRQ